MLRDRRCKAACLCDSIRCLCSAVSGMLLSCMLSRLKSASGTAVGGVILS